METFDVYTAVVFQTESEVVQRRADIKKNLNRIVEFCGRIASYSVTAKPPDFPEYQGWAPVKLLAFPEYCLQGNALKFGMDAALIEIPGEETEILSDIARKGDVFISCCAIERLPEFSDRYFNCNFIIDPSGKIIHKYHKFNMAFHLELATSPHDVYEEYYEAYGNGRSRLQTFFPVADTAIGKIGTLICHDGRINENWRALALNGAEIIIHGNFVEPTSSPPRDHRELAARWGAVSNVAYVVAPQLGAMIRKENVKYYQSGGSMIVDPEGVVIARAPYPGEAMTSAVIRLDHLRRRRMDTGFNVLSELRTEIYREMFEEAIYPPGILAPDPIRDASEIYEKRDPYSLGVMKKLVERGVLTLPKDWKLW
jgi:predicted amidohydrolase